MNKLGLLAFSVMVAYWPGLISSAFMPRWWLIALGLPLVSVLDWWKVESKFSVLILCGAVWAGITITFTPHPHSAVLGFYFLCLSCLAGIAIANEKDPSRVLKYAAYGIAASSLLTIIQHYGLIELPHAGPPAGLLLNSEVLAELTAPMLIWVIFRKEWVLSILFIISLLICNSRLADVVVIASIFFFWKPKNLWYKLPLPIIAISGAILSTLLDPMKYNSAMHRFVLWGTGFHALTPLGRGLDWWSAANPVGILEFLHSDLLQAGVEIGFGSLFFLAAGILLLLRPGKLAEKGAFLGIFIECLFSFPLHIPATAFLASLLAGSLAKSCNSFRVERPERGTFCNKSLGWPTSPGCRLD